MLADAALSFKPFAVSDVYGLSAFGYFPQRSAYSTVDWVDCVNAEIGIFQSLCDNETVSAASTQLV